MKLQNLILSFVLAVIAPQVFAVTTYYVRTGGGTPTQCVGTTNADYPGSGTAQACAWSNLQYALPPGLWLGDGTPPPRIAAGDTVVIAAGTYPMGYGTPGAETCFAGDSYACSLDTFHGHYMPNNVTITGMSGGTCTSKPVLWGGARQANLIDVTHTTGVTISCLELTDHDDSCADWNAGYTAGVVAICTNASGGAQDGIDALGGITNLTLTNVYIHGFTHDGIHIGGANGITADHLHISGNAEAGWDGDIGHGPPNPSSNSGTILIKNSEISWNGCVESYPLTATPVTCVGADQGGYGDGLGTYHTGGNWRVINSKFLHNTSDGLDLVYADGTGSVFVDMSTSEFNASQQFKAAGPTTIQNSIANGDCSEFKNMGTGLKDSERCRASGNAMELDPTGPSQTITVQNTTVTGDGDCLIISGDPNIFTPVSSDVINIKSVIMLGQVSFLQKNEGAYTCAFYTSAGVETVNYSGPSIMWRYRNNTCVTGLTCVDPKLANETGATFDATPLAGSPALGGTTICTTKDWGAQTRGSPCTIGAIETTTTPQQPNYAGN